ncbi:MAG: 3-hydroxybutyrate dehydrogenase [Hyphomicrobiaceae bacterium]
MAPIKDSSLDVLNRPTGATAKRAEVRPLTGKTALVTGSSSGIGLAIANALAQAGAGIVMNGLGDPAAVEAARRDLAIRHVVHVSYSAADMSKPDDIAAMVAETESHSGQVDILVNNAGIQHVEAIETFPTAKWDQILAINLSSAFHTIRAALPGMKRRGWGRIINVASAHALVASPYKSAYVAAKHGLLGLTKTVALETAEHGITVNAICPGYVLTPLVEKQIPETARARGISEAEVIKTVLLAAQPTKQFVTADSLGALTVFLASEAAAQVTGAALPVDGGWTAH